MANFIGQKNGISYIGGSTGGTTYIFVELPIGDWNMDSTNSVGITHGLSLTEWKTIRDIDILIRGDADTTYYSLFYDVTTPSQTSGWWTIDNTNIGAFRVTGGFFDSTSFDATSYNRGFISFFYKPD